MTGLRELLGRPAFRRLLVASGLSQFAEFAQLAALATVGLAVLHRAGAWASVLLAQALPQTALMPAAGAVSDRYGASRAAAAAGIVQAVLAAALAWQVGRVGHHLAAWELYAYAVLLGASLGITVPAFTAAVPDVVPGAALRAANGLSALVGNLSRFLGPTVVAALAKLGETVPFALAATAWAVASALLAARAEAPECPARIGNAIRSLATGRRVRTPAVRPRGDRAATPDGPRAGRRPIPKLDPLGGLRAVRGDPVLLALLVLVAVFALGYSTATYVGLPALAALDMATHAGATATLLAAWGGGAWLGALAAGAWHRLPQPGRSGALAAVAAGVCMAVVAAARSLWLAAAELVAGGAAYSICLVLTLSLVQARAPAAVRGSAVSLLTLGFFGAYPVAYGLAALAAGSLGPRAVVAAGAALMTLGGGSALLHPALRAVQAPDFAPSADAP